MLGHPGLRMRAAPSWLIWKPFARISAAIALSGVLCARPTLALQADPTILEPMAAGLREIDGVLHKIEPRDAGVIRPERLI